jgi:hypothetical protein
MIETAQSKELKERSMIATRNDYATVAARSDNPEIVQKISSFQEG